MLLSTHTANVSLSPLFAPSRDDITPLLCRPPLVTCRENDTTPLFLPSLLPCIPLFLSPPPLPRSATYRPSKQPLNVKALSVVVKQYGPWASLLAVFLFFFLTPCPRARGRYYNRINVYLSLSVTHLLSQVWQDGFAVNKRLERESVPDSRLWGFHPRHLWNNDIKCVSLCCSVFFFFRRLHLLKVKYSNERNLEWYGNR